MDMDEWEGELGRLADRYASVHKLLDPPGCSPTEAASVDYVYTLLIEHGRKLRAENERLKREALADARAEVAEGVWAIESMYREEKLKRDDLVEQVRSMRAENERLKSQVENQEHENKALAILHSRCVDERDALREAAIAFVESPDEDRVGEFDALHALVLKRDTPTHALQQTEARPVRETFDPHADEVDRNGE